MRVHTYLPLVTEKQPHSCRTLDVFTPSGITPSMPLSIGMGLTSSPVFKQSQFETSTAVRLMSGPCVKWFYMSSGRCSSSSPGGFRYLPLEPVAPLEPHWMTHLVQPRRADTIVAPLTCRTRRSLSMQVTAARMEMLRRPIGPDDRMQMPAAGDTGRDGRLLGTPAGRGAAHTRLARRGVRSSRRHGRRGAVPRLQPAKDRESILIHTVSRPGTRAGEAVFTPSGGPGNR